nr:glutathione S-transferase [Mythimna separata]
MGVKLYTLDLSPPARSVMMTCDLFNVPFEKITVNLLEGDHLTPEFLKKNPLHTIPVLEDGDVTLHDSHAIMQYLADAYGKEDSWYPKDVKKRALVNQKLFFNISILFPRIRNITYPLIIEGNKNVDPKRYEDIAEAYGFVEEFLSRTTYLAADHITIADVAALSSMTSLEALLPIDAKKFPKTTAWLTNLKKTSFSKNQNESGATALGELIKKYLA